MARSSGIRLGHRHATVVLLDGSAKRPKLRSHLEVEVPVGEPEPLAALSEAVKTALKGAKWKLSDTEVRLCVDSALAAFRPLALPFAEKAKIEEVLKFEVESRLPHWDIDDVVVDFHVRRSTPVESDLLVVAVRKADLAARIEAATKAGLEPNDAEIEASALFEAARQGGYLSVDGAQLLVHVGERTTTLVVAEAGRLASMRALQLDLSGQTNAEPSAEGEEPAPAPAPGAGHRDVSARRLARELGRMLAAGQREHPIGAVYLCGTSFPELVAFDEHGNAVGPYAHVEGLPIAPLDALKDAAPELPLHTRLLLVPAFGAALHGLGANGLTPNLRREELRYAGKFERLEVPLGVLGLFLVTLTAALFIVDYKIVEARQLDLHYWIKSNDNFLLGSTTEGTRGRLPLAPDVVKNYSRRIAGSKDGDPERTHYEQLSHLNGLLLGEVTRLERELGTRTEIEPPQSALEALTHVLDVIHGMRDQLGRFSIRESRAEYRQGTGGASDYVQITLNMTFWGDLSSTRAYNDLLNELERRAPWVRKVENRPTTTLEGGNGIYVDGIAIEVDTKSIPKPTGGGGAS